MPWRLPEDQDKYLMSHVHRFLDGPSGRDHTDIHLALTRQPNPGDEARAKVDHSLIEPRHVGVRVEHHRPPIAVLLRDQVIGLSQEDLTGKVAALLAAQTALDSNGLERELTQADGHLTAAALANCDEGLAWCRPLEHEISIGE